MVTRLAAGLLAFTLVLILAVPLMGGRYQLTVAGGGVYEVDHWTGQVRYCLIGTTDFRVLCTGWR